MAARSWRCSIRGVRRGPARRPAEDLATRIVHAEVDGDQMDVIDFNLFFLLLVERWRHDPEPGRGRVVTFFAEPEQRRRLRRIWTADSRRRSRSCCGG